MKKFVASVLVLVMMFSLCAPVMATESLQRKNHYGEFEYVDALGDQFHGIYTRDDEKAEVVVYDETGNLMSRAVREHGSDFIVETVTKKESGGALESRSRETETRTININDYIIPVPERQGDVASPASLSSLEIDLPGYTYYTKKGTYTTDYIYQGNILKGDGYFRQNGDYYEYDRMSYKFVRNTTINAIFLVLGGAYGWVTETIIKNILISAGIGFTGVVITTDWVFNGCAKSFGYDIQCRMKYNGANVTMSQITRNLEYLLVEDEDGNVIDCYFDDFSYSTPAQAITAWCSEAVGYGAKAFSYKYITGANPSLPLPVTGPNF